MRTAIRVWWHCRVLNHHAIDVPNGVSEPGVECWREPANDLERVKYGAWIFCRWIPSDGGHGR